MSGAPQRIATLAGAFLFAGAFAAALASVASSLDFAAYVAAMQGPRAAMVALGRSFVGSLGFHAFVFLVGGLPFAAAGTALAEWRPATRPLAFALGGALVPLNPLLPPAQALFGKNDPAFVLALLAGYAAIGALGGVVYWRLAGRRIPRDVADAAS